MAAAITEILFRQPNIEKLRAREQLDKFGDWFSRCHNTLHFTAFLILGDSERAERAVQSCWFRASRKLPGFENEGPFRSWLLRLLISEALSMLHQSHPEAFGRKRPCVS
jgi:DNA-directed RNA polymerase specialized sigma24 family protein